MRLELDDKKVLSLADDYRRALTDHLSKFSTVEIKSVTWPTAQPTVQLGNGASQILLRFDVRLELLYESVHTLALAVDDIALGIFSPMSTNDRREWGVPKCPDMKIIIAHLNHGRDNYHPDKWCTEASLAVFTHLNEKMLKKIVEVRQDQIKRDPKWV